MTKIRTEALTEQQDKSKYAFEVQFIMNTKFVRIIDLRRNMRVDTTAEVTVTEENFKKVFEDLVCALVHLGHMKLGELMLCTTFPVGSRMVDNPVVN